VGGLTALTKTVAINNVVKKADFNVSDI